MHNKGEANGYVAVILTVFLMKVNQQAHLPMKANDVLSERLVGFCCPDTNVRKYSGETQKNVRFHGSLFLFSKRGIVQNPAFTRKRFPSHLQKLFGKR